MRIIGHGDEPKALVIAGCPFINSIDEQTNASRFCVDSLCPNKRINQHQLTQSFSLKTLVYTKSAQPYTWDTRRKLLPVCDWQVPAIQLCQSQHIVAADTSGLHLMGGNKGFR